MGDGGGHRGHDPGEAQQQREQHRVPQRGDHLLWRAQVPEKIDSVIYVTVMFLVSTYRYLLSINKCLSRKLFNNNTVFITL